jgi:hypothetical protein
MYANHTSLPFSDGKPWAYRPHRTPPSTKVAWRLLFSEGKQPGGSWDALMRLQHNLVASKWPYQPTNLQVLQSTELQPRYSTSWADVKMTWWTGTWRIRVSAGVSAIPVAGLTRPLKHSCRALPTSFKGYNRSSWNITSPELCFELIHVKFNGSSQIDVIRNSLIVQKLRKKKQQRLSYERNNKYVQQNIASKPRPINLTTRHNTLYII